MATSSIEHTRVVLLKLTETEAAYLSMRLQNYEHGDLQDEPPQERRCREAIFTALEVMKA